MLHKSITRVLLIFSISNFVYLSLSWQKIFIEKIKSPFTLHQMILQIKRSKNIVWFYGFNEISIIQAFIFFFNFSFYLCTSLLNLSISHNWSICRASLIWLHFLNILSLLIPWNTDCYGLNKNSGVPVH